jgi:pre-mRNA-processing factor 19
LDLSSDGSVALTGGPDKTVQVFDLSDKKTVATLKGHTKPVNQVAFVEDNLAVSSSADKTVKVWSSSDSAWTLAHNFTGPKAEVVGFSVHPSKKLVASASADSTWSLHDLATYTTVKTYSPIEGDGGDFAYTSFTGHPDGILHAGGTKSGSIRVWDVRDASSLAGTLDGYAAQPVNSMSFSENGYYLATSTSSEPTVKVFDLRKLALLSSWSLPAENKVSEVRFDASAQFLTVAGTDLRVYANKTWEELLKFEENAGDLTAARWTPGGKEIVVSGMDRCLRVLGSAS